MIGVGEDGRIGRCDNKGDEGRRGDGGESRGVVVAIQFLRQDWHRMLTLTLAQQAWELESWRVISEAFLRTINVIKTLFAF